MAYLYQKLTIVETNKPKGKPINIGTETEVKMSQNVVFYCLSGHWSKKAIKNYCKRQGCKAVSASLKSLNPRHNACQSITQF